VADAVPDGVKPPPLSMKSWTQVFSSPLLMGMVAVTVLSAAGQFTLFSHFAPYYRQVVGADAAGVTFLFFWFGVFGLIGNLVLTRQIDSLGAARCANTGLVLMTVALLIFPISAAGGVALMAGLLVPWALGCFASNSAQQAGLSQTAPALAPALLALNTSALYLGQALCTGGGGAMLAADGFGALSWVGLAWMVAALALSLALARRMQTRGPDAKQTAHG